MASRWFSGFPNDVKIFGLVELQTKALRSLYCTLFLMDPKEWKVTKMKSLIFLHLITNKWTYLFSTYLFWIVSKSLKSTYLTFHLKSTWIITESHKNKNLIILWTITHKWTQLKITHITILNTFIKSDISTQPLTPPENHIKIFKNQKLPLKPPYNTLYFINILPSQNIWTFRDMDPFLHQYPKFKLFDLKNPKIQTSQIPSSSIIPNPNQTKIAKKIQNWSSSWLSNCYTDTFGRPCL